MNKRLIQDIAGRRMLEDTLKGSDELFFHEDVVKFYERVMNEWDFECKNIALLLGCSMHKPYSNSLMHKRINNIIHKNGLERYVQQYIIGEPLAICPREWENMYPASNYDFPPKNLGERGRQIFVNRLQKFFEKAANYYARFISFAPNHHKRIIIDASKDVVDVLYVSYNLFNTPELLRVLTDINNKLITGA